jgi:LmbE family N-acetylglucosaminyl deacetylase
LESENYSCRILAVNQNIFYSEIMLDSYQKIFGDKQKVMFVFSHPDDAEIYAGGTIARLTSDGKEVCTVKMTNGNKGSRQDKISLNELAKIRRSEDADAMKVLEVKPENNIHLDLGDGEVEDNVETIEKLVKVIRTFKPEIVVTHNSENTIIRFSEGVNWVNHRDHLNTGKVTTFACYPFSRDLSFFPNQFADENVASHTVAEFMYVDSYGHPDEVFIDVTDFMESKVKSIAAHKSQYSEKDARESSDFFTGGVQEGKNFERFRYVIAD